jgi:hypothetical protein
MVYAIISAFLFVMIGMMKRMYELYKPVQKYIHNFGTVWFYWLIVITFLAYFGQ